MKNSEQPIIPFISSNGTPYDANHLGLTKREYFAGLAMQGILSQYTEMAANGASTEHFGGMQMNIAIEAVNLADELLKQLDK